MKLHIGSGSVFLLGYLNIDVRTPRTYLASDRPDLVERYATTEDEYYSRHKDHGNVGAFATPLEQEYVCDRYGDFTALPVATSTCTEVLCRQSFEHLSYTEARRALEQIETVLEPNGILRIDVPDADETVRLLATTSDPFYARHLLGPRRDDHGYHVMGYNRDALKKLVESCGFTFQLEEPNIHPYPAFCLRFVKSVLPAPRNYVTPPWKIEESWSVVEVGPGCYPHPRANLYVDIDEATLRRIRLEKWQGILIADLEAGLPTIADKQFDYVWCSHVIEHMEDPAKAVATLCRIAKRGTIVVPSAIKEALYNFAEPTHKWMVLPHPHAGPPVFVRRNGQYDSIIDSEVQHIMHRFLQSGPNNHQDGQYIRNWYRTSEPCLDVVVHFEDKLELVVIG